MVVSGSCIGAHNTAVYFALHSLGAKTVLISLMATVSALPYTLFTLPAGAIADMIDRKKILLWVQLWHAFIAIALAVLWMTHLLNPYLILASAFLFSDRDPIRAIHSRDQNSSGPARVVFVLHLYYSLLDASARLKGTTSSSC